MCRVLILDDNRSYAESLQPVVNHFEDNGSTASDIASTLEEALDLAISAVRTGRPYTVFLVDQRLGAGKDGIAAMGDLRKVSPSSDAIIFTGIEDPDVGIRAYRAGAFRYLAKPIEPEELIFVLSALMRSRREKVENKWRKVFSEMMGTALDRIMFDDVADVVIEYSIQLGFTSAHLFWAPRQSLSDQRSTFVGVACTGDGCIPSFSEIKFELQKKPVLGEYLQSRDAISMKELESGKALELGKEFEAIGIHLPVERYWILPLWGGDELLGALLLDVGEGLWHLNPHEQTLLDFFARQVSVILGHAGLYGREVRTSEEMKLLQRANVEMLRIANLDEERFWITVLTIATANFGLSFNRAMLFLTAENQRILRGQAAIGTNNAEDARAAWEFDVERRYDFDAFLADIIAGRIVPTPLHGFIRNREIAIADFGERIRGILSQGGIIELSEQEAWKEFPASITSDFAPANCALLSLQAGNTILGLVVVDNKYNNKPFNKNSLQHLKALLANVGLVWETVRQRARSEDLLEANHEILGGAGHQSLQETLNIICKTARKFSQADWAIVYPVQNSMRMPFYEFELDQFGYDGHLKNPSEVSLKQPGIGGLTMHILHKGELIVQDVAREAPLLSDVNLLDSRFVQSEEVKAMIGITIKDPDTLEPSGILYLDYLQPHSFDEMEIRHAHSFARLAAVAISNSRRLGERRWRMQMRTALEISEMVGAQLNIEEIMVKVLERLRVRFQNTALCVLLYDEDKKALEFAPRTLQYYEIANPEYQSLRTFPIHGSNKGSIACKVAKAALASRRQEYVHAPDVRNDPDYLALNPKTTAELCVSLMDGSGNLLGVLALEREQKPFEDDDVSLVEVVANQLAQAIERSQSSERLAFKETVATMTSWASDIAHDINSEVGQIRGNAYLIKLMSENDEIIQYADEIDESAKNLTSVGPWSTQAKKEILLDESLQGFLEPIVSQRNVKLELDLRAPELCIKVNPTEFQHVLRHLVRNSVRAMESSGETKEKKISVSTRPLSDGRVEILFQDYGPGISDEVRTAIFQRKTTTKPTSGGYGLLISRQLVDDMDGKITLLPGVPGQGAIFSIKLPIVSDMPNVE